MSKSKTASALKTIHAVDWTGVRLQRVEYELARKIFAQGDPATSVMYVEKGAVRLSVLPHAEKEAVVAPSSRGRPFLRRGVPRGPVAANGDCDGYDPVHDPGC